MAVQNPPYSMQTGSHGAELFRRAVGSVLNTAGGVVALSDLAVTANSPAAMNVVVASGSIWIPGTTNTAQGMYHCFNDASVTLAIAAASATNPRIDTIVAQVEDAAYAGATNAWKLAVVTGTATVGATLANLTGAGAVPASSLVLAYVLVDALAVTIAAAKVQDNRIFARPNLPLRVNPTCKFYMSTAQALTGASTNNILTLNTTSYNNGGQFTRSGNTILVPYAGYYQIMANVTLATSSNIWLSVSGSSLGAYVSENISLQHQISDVAYFAAGSAATLNAFNFSAGVNTIAGQVSLGLTLVSI